MAYIRKTWVNVPDPSQFTDDKLNSFPRFDADNMNRIEDGIEEIMRSTENWIFTLEDGSKVTKVVCVK